MSDRHMLTYFAALNLVTLPALVDGYVYQVESYFRSSSSASVIFAAVPGTLKRWNRTGRNKTPKYLT